MARKIDLTKSPPSHCPKILTCQINKCPLSKNYEKLKNDPSDTSRQQKEKCTSKRIRKEIGRAFGLKYGGMTTREFNTAKTWGKLTEEDKKARIDKLHDSSPVSRLIKAGCMVSPKKKIISKNHMIGREKSCGEGING